MSTAATTPQKITVHASAENRRTPGAWAVLVGLILVALAWLFPLYIAVANAFKKPAEFAQKGALAFPEHIDFTAIKKFWNDVNYGLMLKNSIMVSLFVAVVGVTLSFLTAYAIGIGRVKGRMTILALFMVAFTLPQEASIYPLYTIAQKIGLYDNKLSIMLVGAIAMSGFGTYMLSSVLSEFPHEMLEAARVDGANSRRILWNIVLPLVRPTLLVLATFFFIWQWNEFLIPLVLLPSNDNQTVALALGVTTGQYTSDPTTRAAAALVGFLPSLMFFIAFQRTLMRGVTMGSVK